MHPLNAARQTKLDAENALTTLLAAQLAAAEEGKRDFTAEEIAARTAAEGAIATAQGRIDVLQRVADLEKAKATMDATGIVVMPPNFTEDPKKGFKGHHEFLRMVMAQGDGPIDNIKDERLKFLAQRDQTDPGKVAYLLPVGYTPRFGAAVGSDEQGAYSDPYGGFSVRPTFLPGMLQLGFEGDPTAGRTTNIPMASPSVEMLARTDKNHTTSVSGGFTVGRRAETVAFAASRGAMEMVTLKASMVAGLAYATEEILSDSVISFLAFIDAGFRDQFGHYMLGEKLRGLGGDQFLGVLTALDASSLGPTISIAKEGGQVAATINFLNILKMRAQCWGYGQAVWIANHDTYVQLAQIAIPVGTGGGPIYQPSMQEDRPDMLLGRPIFYSEYASTLGTVGDLILANWSQYLEGVYQPLQSAESVHVRFVNHERTFKFWLRNAGAPWWKSALTPNKSTTKLSPFVVLATRA